MGPVVSKCCGNRKKSTQKNRKHSTVVEDNNDLDESSSLDGGKNIARDGSGVEDITVTKYPPEIRIDDITVEGNASSDNGIDRGSVDQELLGARNTDLCPDINLPVNLTDRDQLVAANNEYKDEAKTEGFCSTEMKEIYVTDESEEKRAQKVIASVATSANYEMDSLEKKQFDVNETKIHKDNNTHDEESGGDPNDSIGDTSLASSGEPVTVNASATQRDADEDSSPNGGNVELQPATTAEDAYETIASDDTADNEPLSAANDAANSLERSEPPVKEVEQRFKNNGHTVRLCFYQNDHIFIYTDCDISSLKQHAAEYRSIPGIDHYNITVCPIEWIPSTITPSAGTDLKCGDFEMEATDSDGERLKYQQVSLLFVLRREGNLTQLYALAPAHFFQPAGWTDMKQKFDEHRLLDGRKPHMWGLTKQQHEMIWNNADEKELDNLVSCQNECIQTKQNEARKLKITLKQIHPDATKDSELTFKVKNIKTASYTTKVGQPGPAHLSDGMLMELDLSYGEPHRLEMLDIVSVGGKRYPFKLQDTIDSSVSYKKPSHITCVRKRLMKLTTNVCGDYKRSYWAELLEGELVKGESGSKLVKINPKTEKAAVIGYLYGTLSCEMPKEQHRVDNGIYFGQGSGQGVTMYIFILVVSELRHLLNKADFPQDFLNHILIPDKAPESHEGGVPTNTNICLQGEEETGQAFMITQSDPDTTFPNHDSAYATAEPPQLSSEY